VNNRNVLTSIEWKGKDARSWFTARDDRDQERGKTKNPRGNEQQGAVVHLSKEEGS